MKNKGLLIIIIVLIGIIIPFVPYVHVVQMFFLLIPYAIIIIVSAIYLIVSLFNKKKNSWEIAFKTSLLPIFIATQLFSGFAVDKIQRKRSELIIRDIELIKQQTNQYPENFNTRLGIAYKKDNKRNCYQIMYSRGFFVTEKYSSETRVWKSFGWND